jgi:hypothetical protein
LVRTPRQAAQFDAPNGQRKLLAQLGVASLATWQAQDMLQAHAAAAALLAYAEHTQGRALSHVREMEVARDHSLIELPATTRRNLELVQTLRGEDSPTVFSLLDTCQTSMGSRQLKRWLLEPPRDRSLAQQRLDAVTALQGAQGAGPWKALREAFKGVTDVGRVGARIALRRADWPAARHDAKRTGLASGKGDLTKPDAYWKYFLGGSLSGAGLMVADVEGDGSSELVLASGDGVAAKRPPRWPAVAAWRPVADDRCRPESTIRVR